MAPKKAKKDPPADPAYAEAFIAKYGKDRDEEWHGWTRYHRRVDPELFNYAERRGCGREPPPDRLRWKRSPGECKYHRRMVDIIVHVRQDGSNIFDAIHYDRPYSGRGAPANIGSPVDEPLGPKNETKAQGGWNLSDGTFAVEPQDPRVPSVDYQVVGKDFVQECFKEHKKLKPSPNPDDWQSRQPESPRRPGARRWSKKRTEQLIDLAFQKEVEDWNRIASKVGHPVDECQAKWRELASLQLNALAPQAWTVKQEAELMRFVDDYGMTDWVRISHFVEHTPEACIAKHAELTSSQQASQSEAIGQAASANMRLAADQGPLRREVEDALSRGPSAEASSSGASNRRGLARPNASNKRRRNDEGDESEQLPPKKVKRSTRGPTSPPDDVPAMGVVPDAHRDRPKGHTRPRSGKRKLDDGPEETGPRGKKLRLNGPVREDLPAQASGVSSSVPGVPATIGTSQDVSAQRPQLVSESRRILRLRPPKAPAMDGDSGPQEEKQASGPPSRSTPIGKRVPSRQRRQRLQDSQTGSTRRVSKATVTEMPARPQKRGQATTHRTGAEKKRRQGKAGDKAKAERFHADVANLENEMKGLPPNSTRTSKRLQLKRTKAS